MSSSKKSNLVFFFAPQKVSSALLHVMLCMPFKRVTITEFQAGKIAKVLFGNIQIWTIKFRHVDVVHS